MLGIVVDALPAAAAFEDSLSTSIVDVMEHGTIVIQSPESILLVPHDPASLSAQVVLPACGIAIGIVAVGIASNLPWGIGLVFPVGVGIVMGCGILWAVVLPASAAIVLLRFFQYVAYAIVLHS